MIRPAAFDPATAVHADLPLQFSGVVSRTDLFRAGDADSGGGTDITGVYFAPGSRTVPHTHSVDQVLYARRRARPRLARRRRSRSRAG